LKFSDEQIFEKVFTDWFGGLHAYAFSILKDETMAEEAVQSVFCRIWEKRDELQIHTSIKAYLYGSVYRECLNWLRQDKNKRAYKSHVMFSAGHSVMENASAKAEMGELEKKLNQTLDELPEQRRAIFQLSRFGELKYREIAEQLGISVKTVESQMTKALKELRKKLIGFIE
jgi:RNA polymerase sigma-70 factor, ECF subfamily